MTASPPISRSITAEADPGLRAFELGRIPRLRFGAGAISALPEVIAAHGRQALIITGGRSFRGSERWPALRAALEAGGISWATASVESEPSPDDVDEIVAGHRGAGLEVVVGIGGGSALDTAKAVAGLLPGGGSVREHLEGVGPSLPLRGPTLPFVAVPTTAGTGSEATRNAVLTERGPRGFKRSFRDERLVAVEAIVDPDLLAGAPANLIAANGLDALTQLLEPYVSPRAGPLTDALALDGLAKAADALPVWSALAASKPQAPSETTAGPRKAMGYAALLSGICLANAGLGAVHGLASPLGALVAIPHGFACGAVLVAVVETNIAALEARAPESPALARYAEVGRIVAGGTAADRLAGRSGGVGEEADARAALVAWLSDLTRSLAVPGLGAFGLTSADIPTLVAGSRGSSMRTNPVELTDAEIAAILERSL